MEMMTGPPDTVVEAYREWCLGWRERRYPSVGGAITRE